MKNVRIACALLVAAMMLGSVAGCQQVLYAPQYQKVTVSHLAIIYLKNHGEAGDRQKIIEATRELRTIPRVYDIELGTVLASDRPIVVERVSYFARPGGLGATSSTGLPR